MDSVFTLPATASSWAADYELRSFADITRMIGDAREERIITAPPGWTLAASPVTNDSGEPVGWHILACGPGMTGLWLASPVCSTSYPCQGSPAELLSRAVATANSLLAAWRAHEEIYPF